MNCPRCRLSSLSSFASAVLSSASASMPASTFGCRPYSKMIDRKTGLPLHMPPWLPAHFRNLGNIKSAAEHIRPIDVAKKKEGHYAPPSGQPVSRFPACQFALPETLGALWGQTPPHGKFYRGHARHACHAHHAKRQVYQPGLSPLSRANVF